MEYDSLFAQNNEQLDFRIYIVLSGRFRCSEDSQTTNIFGEECLFGWKYSGERNHSQVCEEDGLVLELEK